MTLSVPAVEAAVNATGWSWRETVGIQEPTPSAESKASSCQLLSNIGKRHFFLGHNELIGGLKHSLFSILA